MLNVIDTKFEAEVSVTERYSTYYRYVNNHNCTYLNTPKRPYLNRFKLLNQFYLKSEEIIVSICRIDISPSAFGSWTLKIHLRTSSGPSRLAIPSVAKITSRNPINLAPQPRFRCPYNLNTWHKNRQILSVVLYRRIFTH